MLHLSDSNSYTSEPRLMSVANANIPVNSLAPYERRVIELLRNSKDKRARKLAKKRVCVSAWSHHQTIY
jgi:hypothetical protein